MNASQPLCDDGSFGPTVRHCRGGFDFTLLFEQSFLSIAPSALFILLSIARLTTLLTKTKRIVSGTTLQRVKLLAITAYGVVIVALLASWALQNAYWTKATLPAAILSLLNVFVLAVLSWFEHAYSPRPSVLIGVYLLFSVLFDAVQTRTLWLKDEGETIPALFTTALAVKIGILTLESLPKDKYLPQIWREKSPETRSGLFGKSLLLWLRNILVNGRKRLLVPDDLYALDSQLETKRLSDAFGKVWSSSATSASKPTALWTIAKTLKWPLLAPVIPRLVQAAFTIFQSLLLRDFLLYLKDEESYVKGTGYGFIGAYGLVYCGIAISTCFYWRLTYKCLVKMRGCLVAAIYQKTVEIDTSSYDMTAPVSLMSTDIERILQGCKDFHEIWANVIQVAVSTWLLYESIGIACVAPAVVAILSTAGSLLMSSYADKAQEKWMEATQERVDATAKAISSMKIVRLLGLADYLDELLTNLRTAELHAARYFRCIEVLTATVSFAPLLLSPVFTFMVFLIQNRNTGVSLDTTRTFTTLSLLQLMTQPLVWLFQAIPLFVASLGCLGRVGSYLNAQPRVDKRTFKRPKTSDSTQSSISALEPEPDSEDQDISKTNSSAIKIDNGEFGWIDKKPVLQNININVPKDKLTMIVGPVASGKTSLCKAMIGEMPFSTGTVKLDTSGKGVAYCDQNTFLMNGTVQQNILGFSSFDSEWYDTVVRAVDLSKDISALPDGSQTNIGTKGTLLSGGQRQRVAIARAVYARTSVAVFDDVLSGLDAVTKRHVFRNVFSSEGLLHKNGCTVVLCTHDFTLMPQAHHIIALSRSGNLTRSGTYEELSQTSDYVMSLGVGEKGKGKVEESQQHEEMMNALPFDQPEIESVVKEDMTRRLGDSTIYKYLFGHIGLWRMLLFALFQCGWAVFSTIGPVWLKFWASANESGERHDGYYIGVYAVFQSLALLFLGLFAVHTLTSMAVKCGASLHNVLLKTVNRAAMSFFATVDAGVTTNRFSQDILLIDGELPMALLETVSAGLVAFVQLILIAVAAPYVAIVYPVLIGLLYTVQNFYLRTSRQLRFLELEAKSPLYTHFLETLHGLSTIRSFGWSDESNERNLNLVDGSQQPLYLLYMVQRWLQLVLELLIAIVAVVLISVAVSIQSTSVSFIGVALVNLMSIGQELKMIVINWTMLETSLCAIARTKTFEEKTLPEHKPNEIQQLPATWPEVGNIHLNDVSASYSSPEEDEDVKKALDNVTINIRSGEKIALCGRSGSGKSSLVMTLARMIDLTSGSITIDGVDVSNIPRSKVRSSLNIIPQEAYFFYKTLSLNLDPSGTASAEDMQQALEQVQLWDVVKDSGGLESTLDVETLSLGQKQLLALARAMLRPGKIVILDEATSSVDKHVAALMQEIIQKQFQDKTVIAVAHQLSTIKDFDRVMVMDSGKVAETGSPRDLYARDGIFKRLCDIQGLIL